MVRVPFQSGNANRPVCQNTSRIERGLSLFRSRVQCLIGYSKGKADGAPHEGVVPLPKEIGRGLHREKETEWHHKAGGRQHIIPVGKIGFEARPDDGNQHNGTQCKTDQTRFAKDLDVIVMGMRMAGNIRIISRDCRAEDTIIVWSYTDNRRGMKRIDTAVPDLLIGACLMYWKQTEKTADEPVADRWY